MLKKHFRLKSPILFKKTLGGQRICANSNFVVLGLPRRLPSPGNLAKPKMQSVRFGFVVSKKIHKRAVRRNRIKRQYREIIRKEIIPRFVDVLDTYSAIIVLARTGSLTATYQELERGFVRCFQQKQVSK